MLINNNFRAEDLQNLNVIEFREELYFKVKNFSFSSLQLDILFNEIDSSKEFENRILEAVCYNLGYDYEYLIENLDFTRIESDTDDLNKLITTQENRIKKVLIRFVLEELPFNHLMKISKINGKYHMKDNIRELLIESLFKEIEKANNLESTLNIIQDTIDSKSQLEKYNNIARKIGSKSNKVILENKFIIGILDEIEESKLENLIDLICQDKLVWDNLY